MTTTDGHKKRRSWRPRVVIPLCVIVLVIVLVLVVVSTSRNTTALTQITEQRRQEYYRDDGTTSATPPSPLPLPPPPPPRATIHRTDDVAIRDDPEPQTSSFLFPKTTTTDFRPSSSSSSSASASASAVLTRLRRGGGDDCTPNPNQSLQRVVESTTFAEYANATTRFFHLSSSSSQPKTPTPTHHSFSSSSSSVLEADDDSHNNNNNNHRNNNVHPILLACEYMAQQAHSKHFAHAMQQLYGCYSYFQLERSVSSITGSRTTSSSSDISTPNNNNNNNSSNSNNYKPRMVLLLTIKVRRQLESNAFLKGFLQLLQNPMGVEIMSRTMYLEQQQQQQQQQQHTTTTTTNRSSSSITDTHIEEIRATSIWVPGGYVLSHSIELHHMVQQRYNWTAVDSCSSGGHNDDDDDDDDSGIRMPRIGILNRRKSSGRSILNVDLLGRELASILHKHNNNDNDNNDNDNSSSSSSSSTTTNATNTNTKVGTSNKHHPNVVIEYFEGGSKSFQDQVSFFQSIDVLISPHGAQLTGLPFLGSSTGSSSCRQILELFPPDYLIPAFYGSLARNANIGYNYLYLKSNINNETTTTMTADRNSQQQQQQEEEEAATDSSSLQGRIQARAANLCPSPNVILESVQELIASFRQCCDARAGE